MLTTLEKILFLRQVELFEEFPAREIGDLAKKAQEVSFSKGQVVFKQGDEGDALYIVLGGKVKVIGEHESSREVLTILEEKSIFGEMAILSNETRSATIEAAEPLTLLKIRREDFKEMIKQKPEMAFEVFEVLVKRIKTINEKYIQALKRT